jgi:nucleoid-associated protein YgaU
MPLTNPASLEKLTISAYLDSKRTRSKGVFEVMFNATSFAIKHQNAFQKLQGINTSGRQARYSHALPREFTLSLILDGTGVIDEVGAQQSVADQIKAFLNLCFYMDGKIHEPRYLKIQCTALNDFDCRLQSVDTKYTLFDNHGSPLRAELATVFIEDLDPDKRVRKEGKSSPDLTHSRIVKKGDTLPLLTREIYGSAVHYLWVAQQNKLDDFRNLTPGQELHFPPLPTERS